MTNSNSIFTIPKSLSTTLKMEKDDSVFNMQVLMKLITCFEKLEKMNFESEEKGVQSKLRHKQLQTLFWKIGGIYINGITDVEHFMAICEDDILPIGFEPIKWTFLTSKKEPHKTAFREFLKLIYEKIP
jgi:hypothetical protein